MCSSRRQMIKHHGCFSVSCLLDRTNKLWWRMCYSPPPKKKQVLQANMYFLWAQSQNMCLGSCILMTHHWFVKNWEVHCWYYDNVTTGSEHSRAGLGRITWGSNAVSYWIENDMAVFIISNTGLLENPPVVNIAHCRKETYHYRQQYRHQLQIYRVCLTTCECCFFLCFLRFEVDISADDSSFFLACISCSGHRHSCVALSFLKSKRRHYGQETPTLTQHIFFFLLSIDITTVTKNKLKMNHFKEIATGLLLFTLDVTHISFVRIHPCVCGFTWDQRDAVWD